jgi:outer membrane biosynthesis protein TonB
MDVEAQRTLVKSPPELWALLSDADSLAHQLVEFGEIRIVSTEPESAVAWEGEDVSGTIQLKASGWGTKVTITASRQPPEPPTAAEPEPAIEPEPVVELTVEPEPIVEPEPKIGFFARIFRRRKPEPVVEPESVVEPEPEPEPETPEPEQPNLAAEQQPNLAAELQTLEESLAAETTAVLTAVLDRLGAAHHRPFSRA